MNNIVSFETAKRLKEAGFPQPEFAKLQLWYNERNIVSIAWANHGNNFDIIQVATPIRVSRDWFYQNMVFAPSATDILLFMPDDTMLYRANLNMFLCWTRKDRLPMIGDGICMDNPAEACAIAWLKFNEK